MDSDVVNKVEAIDKWKRKAFEYSYTDKMGNLFTRVFEVMLTLVENGNGSDNLEYAVESLTRAREHVMKNDKMKDMPLNDFIYGISESLGITASLIIEKMKEKLLTEEIEEVNQDHSNIIAPHSPTVSTPSDKGEISQSQMEAEVGQLNVSVSAGIASDNADIIKNEIDSSHTDVQLHESGLYCGEDSGEQEEGGAEAAAADAAVTARSAASRVARPICEICGRVFTSRSALGVHRASHSDFKCEICGKKTLDQERLDKHRDISHPNGNRWNRVQGETSNDVGVVTHSTPISSNDNRSRKRSNVFYGEESDEGEGSGATAAVAALAAEAATGTAEAASAEGAAEIGHPSFNCDTCSRSFDNAAGLRAHRNIHSAFKCVICGKRTIDAIRMKRHMQVVHHNGLETENVRRTNDDYKYDENSKRFKCKLCGQFFTAKASLKVHRMRHEGLRPFKCQLCPSDFAARALLKGHLRSAHGIKPFDCRICGVEFFRRAQLTQHKRDGCGDAAAAPAATAAAAEEMNNDDEDMEKDEKVVPSSGAQHNDTNIEDNVAPSIDEKDELIIIF